MDMNQRIAEAKARLEAAKAALSDDDRAELEQRKTLSELGEQVEDEERTRRHLDLDRRLDQAQAKLGPTASLEAVSIEKYADTFIVVRNGKAHGSWNQAMSSAAAAAVQGKTVDRGSINRKYAVQVIYDWNGDTDFDVNPERTLALEKFLIANPGIVTPITDAASRLAGIYAEARKSTS